jgi:homoserine O-acetyltransferase/O-succinyltransferase
LAAALVLTAAPAAFAQAPSTTHWPNHKESDFAIDDFRFKSGETLPVLSIHYTTLGTPQRNASGEVTP